jgi:8-oxo-dGTP pyrophosphatase MutT (NUDIX family)
MDLARMPDNRPDIRDAASVILLRRDRGRSEVLMGQRGSGAAFMPSKYVFPGGAVDEADDLVELSEELNPVCSARVTVSGGPTPKMLAAAAIREVWEETGLAIASHGSAALPLEWKHFQARRLVPCAADFRFIFRAITPPGRSRRFDARFFLVDATKVVGDLDDFSAASDELSHLHWLPLAETRRLDLPFITEVVLAEVSNLTETSGPPPPVPFFDNSGPVPTFRRIG